MKGWNLPTYQRVAYKYSRNMELEYWRGYCSQNDVVTCELDVNKRSEKSGTCSNSSDLHSGVAY